MITGTRGARYQVFTKDDGFHRVIDLAVAAGSNPDVVTSYKSLGAATTHATALNDEDPTVVCPRCEGHGVLIGGGCDVRCDRCGGVTRVLPPVLHAAGLSVGSRCPCEEPILCQICVGTRLVLGLGDTP